VRLFAAIMNVNKQLRLSRDPHHPQHLLRSVIASLCNEVSDDVQLVGVLHAVYCGDVVDVCACGRRML